MGQSTEKETIYAETFAGAPKELDLSQVVKGLGKGLSLGKHHDGHKKGKRQHC